MNPQYNLQELFAQYDEDHDGEIRAEQVNSIMETIGHGGLYIGLISKAIRRLNYKTPTKDTINLVQLKEFVDSYETPSRQALWWKKYSAYSFLAEKGHLLKELKESSAAPGGAAQEEAENVALSVLVGPNHANYMNEIQISLQKSGNQQAGKPFIKLQLTCGSNQVAKKTEALFKDCYTGFFKILNEEQPEWKQQQDKLHLNTAVVHETVHIYFTSSSEHMTELIQIYAHFFDNWMSNSIKGEIFINFRFNYDLIDFVDKPQSNFYDIFTKNCKLEAKGSVRNLMKSIRTLIVKEKLLKQATKDDLPAILLLHLQGINLDLEFDNGDFEETETMSKEELKSALNDLREFITKLDSAGMKLKELIACITDTIVIQCSAGDWKAKLSVRVKNLNQLFLRDIQVAVQSGDQNYDSD